MILPKEFYDGCNLSYKKVIDQLEITLAHINDCNDKNATTKSQEIQSAVFNFSRKYLTPKEYWEYCFLNNDIDGSGEEFYDKIVYHSHLHLYYEDGFAFNRYAYKYFKLPRREPNYDGDVTECDLDYPHHFIDKCFRDFERKTTKIPSPKLVKRYEKMKALYPLIYAAEEDEEEWLKLLDEVGDDAFFRTIVERRLGQNFLNIKLWKLYIIYLKKNCHYKYLLEIWSKYCHFYLDDKEMLEKFKHEMDKYKYVNIQWDNLEGHSNDGVEGYDVVSKLVEDESNDFKDVEIKQISPLNKKLCRNFKWQIQDFSLPMPIIRYILKNANHRVLRKLFSSCKYFYFKKPTPICYRLQVCSREETFENETLFLQHLSNQDQFVKKTFITGGINVYLTDQNDETFISNIIPRLFRCEAKFIDLIKQNLTYNELKFLVESECVVELNVRDCDIKDENNDYINLEEITKYLPNIEKLELPQIKTNKNTAHVLVAQKFNSKIVEIFIQSIIGKSFDTNEFLKFLMKNKNDKDFPFTHEFDFSLTMHFRKEYFNVDYVDELKEILLDFQNSSRSLIDINVI